MKIYFAASIRGGRDRADMYPAIVKILEDLGHEILSAMFAKQDIDENEGTDPDKGSGFIYRRDVDWIDKADAVVAEVTQPSLGVGYELGYAETKDMPIICLYWAGADKTLSAMVDGNPNVTVVNYQEVKELEPHFKKLLQ